jgi:L-lactate dehydrogenase complex protein LldG
MTTPATLVEQFCQAATRAGALTVRCVSAEAAIAYILRHAGGSIVLPDCPAALQLNLAERLRAQGGKVICGDLFQAAPTAAAGITGANFALADTGTVVLESTSQAVRLASTLPERHFVLLNPHKILPDHMSAVPLLRRLHSRQSPDFIAFITGPSRTADIERVLTIGVHGPRELHILLLDELSDDFLEN